MDRELALGHVDGMLSAEPLMAVDGVRARQCFSKVRDWSELHKLLIEGHDRHSVLLYALLNLRNRFIPTQTWARDIAVV